MKDSNEEKALILLENIGIVINGFSKCSIVDAREKMEHEELYKKYWAFNSIMLEDYKPFEIAAIMMVQALSIYKTTLPEDEYNKIVDAISEKRDQVKIIGI